MCGPFVVVVFNGEEVLLVVVTLANSHLDEYQRQKVIVLFLGQKYSFIYLYWSTPDLLGVQQHNSLHIRVL